MPNFKFEITDCAIVKQPYINNARTFANGKIHCVDGTIDFEKHFHTFSKEAIEQLELWSGVEQRFKLEGYFTKKAGKEGTKWEGKMFEELVVEKASITNETKKFSARELVEEAKEAFGVSDEEIDEVPF